MARAGRRSPRPAHGHCGDHRRAGSIVLIGYRVYVAGEIDASANPLNTIFASRIVIGAVRIGILVALVYAVVSMMVWAMRGEFLTGPGRSRSGSRRRPPPRTATGWRRRSPRMDGQLNDWSENWRILPQHSKPRAKTSTQLWPI